MSKKNNTRKLWEFEILNFLREEFPRVGLAMPNLQDKPEMWQHIYLITAGINEIARFHDDLVDMRLDMTEELNFEFKFFALRGDLNEDYFNVAHLVAQNNLEGLYEKICRYCPPNQQPDHKQNLAYIEDIVAQGGKMEELHQRVASQQEVKEDLKASPGSFVFTPAPKTAGADLISFGKL